MSAAARVGGYYAASMARAGGSELQCAIARVVGQVVALDPEGIHISARSIAAICAQRGVLASYAGSEHAPAYGTVSEVLEALRAIGIVSWIRAYNSRWHEPGNPDGWLRVQMRDGEYRHAPRYLRIVGAAEAIARGTSLVAHPIDAVRRAAESCARAWEARPRGVPRIAVPQVSTPALLSIGSAPSADRAHYSTLGRWRPPDEID